MSRSRLDYFVLDALAHDVESFEDVVRLVNHPELGWQTEHGGPITPPELGATLRRVVADELVEVLLADGPGATLRPCGPTQWPPSAPVEDLWFRLTQRGSILHANWEAP
jgi:hypothetical protein